MQGYETRKIALDVKIRLLVTLTHFGTVLNYKYLSLSLSKITFTNWTTLSKF